MAQPDPTGPSSAHGHPGSRGPRNCSAANRTAATMAPTAWCATWNSSTMCPCRCRWRCGRARILLKDLLQMGEGSVVELDKMAGEPLDLYVNSRLIARGEAVRVGDKFGIRLTEVVSQSDRLEKLG